MLDTEAEKAEKIPLKKDATGSFRVGGAGVTLDVVIEAYDQGATPEQIVQKFGELNLDDVYAVLTYYLRHSEEVRAYLAARDAEARQLRGAAEATRADRLDRERLMQRRKGNEGSTR